MWKFITGLQGITTQVCKLEKQFCHSTHIAHKGDAVKGQKPVNTEEKKNDLEVEVLMILLLV